MGSITKNSCSVCDFINRNGLIGFKLEQEAVGSASNKAVQVKESSETLKGNGYIF